MATALKNAYLDLTASLADVYTVPASTTAIVFTCQVANVDGTASVDVDVVWTDDSNADKVTYLAKTVSIPADASLNVLAGKVVLETGDKIRAKASAASDAELTLSIMEIS